MNPRLVLAALLLLSLTVPSWSFAQKKPRAKRHGKAAAAKSKKKKAAVSRRVKRIQKAFVASSDLKAMAAQLLQNRSRAAYAGVEAYARRHGRDDAGALAQLVIGYARILDNAHLQAIEPLKKAHLRGGEVADYAAYFLATAYAASGRHGEALQTLRGFEEKYPDSLFIREAVVVHANAFLAVGSAAEAIALLERHRKPTRAEVELALGRAYLKSGDTNRGVAILRGLYYGMPLTADADQARSDLEAVAASVPPASFAQGKSRADLLVQGRRFSEATREYRSLLAAAPAEELIAVQTALASVLQRSGYRREARELLERMPEVPGEAGAQRLQILAEVARAEGDEDQFLKLLDKLRQAAPGSIWLEEALLSGGNMFLLKRDYDRAIDCYRELRQRFPSGKRAAYVHWKAAWLSLRQGRTEEAKREFEQQVTSYPASTEVSAALYWRARLAEDDHQVAKARAYYTKLSQRFRNYYYAELARERLREIGPGETAAEPSLDRIPPAWAPAPNAMAAPPQDDLRFQKAKLLANGGMFDFAVRELQAAGAPWASAQIAQMYQEGGQYHRSVQVLKRAVPSYYALELPELPRNYWEALFPRPYWTDLKKYSVKNQLDPFLVASLIRQESEFNPGAVSRADALGLMQLLPSTGKKVARELRLRRFSSSQLLVADVNLQLGTRYFRSLVDHFDGRLEYALAAYNAGPHRVQAWLADGKYRDTQEFVESIPFTETREYVQAIVRNAAMYRRIYPSP